MRSGLIQKQVVQDRDDYKSERELVKSVEAMLWDVRVVVSLPCLDVIDQYIQVLDVLVLFHQWFTVYKVSLKLGVLEVEDVIVKSFKVAVSHLLDVKGKPIRKDDLQLFGSDVNASINDLLFVAFDFNWLLTVLVSVLPEYLGYMILYRLISEDLGILVWVALKSDLTLLGWLPILKLCGITLL